MGDAEKPAGVQGPKSQPRILNRRLGDILIEHTRLTEEQLAEVLDIQKTKGGRIGEILVQKNFLTHEEILKALSYQMGMPYVESLSVYEVPTSLVANLSISYAKQYEIVPVEETDAYVTVAVSDPLNHAPVDDLRIMYGKDIRFVIAPPSEIQETINAVYERSTTIIKEVEDEAEADVEYDLDQPLDLLEASEEEAPIIRLVNNLLFRAVKERASDIHIEPFEKDLNVRFRVDGVMKDVLKPPKRLQAGIVSRVKVMASLNIAEKRLPQDGRIKIRIGGKEIDIRISTVPTSYGERIVMRLADKSSTILDLDALGFGEESLVKINELISHNHGIILVTGPTGSGKSTTLYSCLSRMDAKSNNILTVEDPVEITIKGVGQVQVNPKIDLTFASALRSFLRQDPDIIMVGEIRDRETAEIAIHASLTGHLVLSTLHTNDAPGAIPRFIDMGVEPFLVASSLLGVIGQRLLRKICPYCKQPAQYSDEVLKNYGFNPEVFRGKPIFKAVGCDQCIQSGYLGRTVIHELFLVTDEVRGLILQNADSARIKKQAIADGMITIRDDGIRKVLRGETTLEEIMRVTQED
jgi:general secretion pathway protein E